MDRAEVRSFCLLAALLVFAFSIPFAVGGWTGNVFFFDAQWMADLATVVLNGLLHGGVYAMFAVGLTLVFGVMRIINIAHGHLVMLGAYLTYVCFDHFKWDPLLALLATLPVSYALGWLIQKALLNAVVWGPELTPLLITFGLGLAMIQIVISVFTTDYRTIPYAPNAIVLAPGINLSANKLISFAMSVVISLSVFFFLKLHRLGKAIRATAQNAGVAMVCGINVLQVYLVTSGVAAALAAAGGALVAIQFGFNPETGYLYTLQAFAIIILGGRGHYIGALIGGLMLAVMESLISFLVPNGTAMVELASYGLMVGVLLIRPRGLMGHRED